MCVRSRRLLFPALLGAAVAVWAADPLLVADQARPTADEDLILGTWHLNLAKSKYSPGPTPENQVRTYEAHRDGVKATIKTTYADGRSTIIQYIANYNRMEYPVTGSTDFDTIALTKVDAYTAEANMTHGGREVGLARRVISKDGRTMTITYRGTDSEGTRIDNVTVYEKEE